MRVWRGLESRFRVPSLALAGVRRLLAMNPVSVGGAVDHDHAAVVEQTVDNGRGPEVVVEILAPVLPWDV